MITTLLFDFVHVLLFPTANGYELNQPLIKFVKQHPELSSHIYSSISPERLAEMRSRLIPPFASIMSSRDFQLSKDDPESYRQIARLLKAKPEEILFTDDKLWHVEAAGKAGLANIHFETTSGFLKTLRRMLG